MFGSRRRYDNSVVSKISEGTLEGCGKAIDGYVGVSVHSAEL